MTLTFHPPRYELDHLEDGNRYLLRQLLSVHPEDAGRPMALVQRAVFNEGDAHLLGQFDFVYRRGGELRRTRVLDGDADHTTAAALLAMKLGVDPNLENAITQVSRAKRLQYDEFMGRPICLEIFHFPNALMLAWEMKAIRIKKLLANNGIEASEGMRRNNPLAALGTLIMRASHSAHDRIAALDDLKDAEARLALLVSAEAHGKVVLASSRPARPLP